MNLLEQFAAFLFFLLFASAFFKGWRLVRFISWTGLWFSVLPVMGPVIDGLVMGLGFWLTEFLYNLFTKHSNATSPR